MSMSVEEIIRLVSLSASLLVSFVGFLVTFIKWIKDVIKNKKWEEVKKALQGFITKAEGFTNFTGEEKKTIVLAWASEFCGTIGMKFDNAKVSATIEDLVSLTKKVNQREKDKIVEETVAETVSAIPTTPVEEKKEGE